MNFKDFRKSHNKDIKKRQSYKLTQQVENLLKQGLSAEQQVKMIDIRQEFQDKLEDLKVENLNKQLDVLDPKEKVFI